jgi:hypothetical protein
LASLTDDERAALLPNGTGWFVNREGILADFGHGELSGERSEEYYAKMGPWQPVRIMAGNTLGEYIKRLEDAARGYAENAYEERVELAILVLKGEIDGDNIRD